MATMTEETRLSLAREAASAFIRNHPGERYKDARFETCQPTPAVRYIQKLRPRQLMILHGPPGCGKTYAAACWIRRNIEKNLYRHRNAPGIYITAAEFERKFCQPGYWDFETKGNWEDLLEAGWVVFDDLGTEDPTNLRFKTKFNHLFETRHREQRTLIILTNVRIEEYGERIVSRVRDWGVDGSVWEIQGEDLRKNKRDLNPVAD